MAHIRECKLSGEMLVHIHRMRRGPEYDNLCECIEYAADRAHIGQDRMVVALTAFFEHMTDTVAVGRVVPVFNVFKVGASLEERDARLKRYNQGFPYCVPRFVAGKPFRTQVKAMAPNSRSAKDILDAYARHTTRRKAGDEYQRVFDDMQRIRASIASQMLRG